MGIGLTIVAVATTFLAQKVSKATIGWFGHFLFVMIMLLAALSSLRFSQSRPFLVRLVIGVATALVAVPVAAIISTLFY
jgi:hypothetical protein